MKILEILLPKSIIDKDLSPKSTQRIDTLQKRMNKYVDKLSDPATSTKGKEFLKSKLKTDYDELRNVIKDAIKESSKTQAEIPSAQFVVIDTKTNSTIGKPYSSRSRARARARADKLDNIYGAYRYEVKQLSQLSEDEVDEHIVKHGSGYRLLSHTGKNLGTFKTKAEAAKHEGEVEYFKKHPKESINEAVYKVPLTEEDFELIKSIMSKPIPAAIAPIYIHEIIDDDDFNNMLNEFAETDPNMDIRPHVVAWIDRVMPDQMYRFNNSGWTAKQKSGQSSIIHGYDSHDYHGSNDPITGDAYGSR